MIITQRGTGNGGPGINDYFSIRLSRQLMENKKTEGKYSHLQVTSRTLLCHSDQGMLDSVWCKLGGPQLKILQKLTKTSVQ